MSSGKDKPLDQAFRISVHQVRTDTSSTQSSPAPPISIRRSLVSKKKIHSRDTSHSIVASINGVILRRSSKKSVRIYRDRQNPCKHVLYLCTPSVLSNTDLLTSLLLSKRFVIQGTTFNEWSNRTTTPACPPEFFCPTKRQTHFPCIGHRACRNGEERRR